MNYKTLNKSCKYCSKPRYMLIYLYSFCIIVLLMSEFRLREFMNMEAQC